MGIGITLEMVLVGLPFLLGLFLTVRIGTKRFATKENPNGMTTKKGRIATAIGSSLSLAVSAGLWYAIYGRGSEPITVGGILLTIVIAEAALWVAILILFFIGKQQKKRIARFQKK